MTRSLRSATSIGVLGVEELAHHPLVGRRLLLDRAVVARRRGGRGSGRAGSRTRRGGARPCLRADGAVRDELLEPRERRLGGLDARLRVLALGAAVVAHAEHADERAAASGPG